MNLAPILGSVALQMGPGPGPGMGTVDPAFSVVGSAIGAFITTLVIGAILVALAPDYLERMMGTVRDEPVGSFVYGIIALVAVVVVAIILTITIVGILVAIPFVILAAVIWAVGAAIAYSPSPSGWSAARTTNG